MTEEEFDKLSVEEKKQYQYQFAQASKISDWIMSILDKENYESGMDGLFITIMAIIESLDLDSIKRKAEQRRVISNLQLIFDISNSKRD